MTKKKAKDQSKAAPVQIDDEKLDAISGGPTAVENVKLNFTSIDTNTTLTSLNTSFKTTGF